MYQKERRIKDKSYLQWIKSLPSVISGGNAEPHHLIGHGHSGMGTKTSDYWAFPLTRGEHSELHHIGWKAWEERYGSQWKYVALTLSRYIEEKNGV